MARVNPVSALLMVTLAPATKAPEGSATVPFNVAPASDCAKSPGARRLVSTRKWMAFLAPGRGIAREDGNLWLIFYFITTRVTFGLKMGKNRISGLGSFSSQWG